MQATEGCTANRSGIGGPTRAERPHGRVADVTAASLGGLRKLVARAAGGGARSSAPPATTAGEPSPFTSAAVAEAVERDGFAVVAVLDENEVESLRRAFDLLGRAPGDAYLACHRSAHSFDPSYRRSADEIVRAHLGPKVDRHLGGVRPVIGEFLVKWPGNMSGLGLHRDPVLVDETDTHSYTLWMAVDRTTEEQLSLWFVPGSHRWTDGRDAAPVAEHLRAHATVVHLEPGHAVLYDRRVLWGTPPKHTDRPLLSAIVSLVPEDATLWRERVEPDGSRSLVADDEAAIVDRNAFLDDPAPDLPARRVLPAPTALTADDLEELLGEAAPDGEATSVERLNAVSLWCHRCGAVDRAAEAPDPWWGTVEVLCADCLTLEPGRVAQAEALGSYAGIAADAGPGGRPEPRNPDVWARCTQTSALPGTHVFPEREDATLRDPVLDEHLRTEGYAVFPEPVLSRADAAALRAEFGRLRGLSGDGFHNDFNDRDRAYRKDADAAISAVLDPVLERTFNDYRAFIRPFLCKFPGQGSYFEPHRDWMYVDEHRGERSYVFFVALEDIDVDNGQVCVLPRSHRFDAMLRGTDMWAPWLAYEEALRERFVTFPLKAGEAAVWNHATVHGSYPNLTDEPRIAAGMWVCPSSAQLVHFRRIDGSTAARYEVDPEFFHLENPYALQAAPPRLPVSEVLPVGGRDLDEEALGEALDHNLAAPH